MELAEPMRFDIKAYRKRPPAVQTEVAAARAKTQRRIRSSAALGRRAPHNAHDRPTGADCC